MTDTLEAARMSLAPPDPTGLPAIMAWLHETRPGADRLRPLLARHDQRLTHAVLAHLEARLAAEEDEALLDLLPRDIGGLPRETQALLARLRRLTPHARALPDWRAAHPSRAVEVAWLQTELLRSAGPAARTPTDLLL